ncbi:MAG: hypothetical protein [Microviridae sp.]|nr:MAG: hypothetical protein [Microviridae sp.]
MSLKQQDILKSQRNAEEADRENSETGKLMEREEIIGTPFLIVGNEEKGYFLALGPYRLTEPTEYKYDVEKVLTEELWNIVIKVISVCLDINKKGGN